MSEIILPGRPPISEVLYLVDKNGTEVEVPREELWQYLPDASSEEFTIVDLADLPYERWQQGENDD